MFGYCIIWGQTVLRVDQYSRQFGKVNESLCAYKWNKVTTECIPVYTGCLNLLERSFFKVYMLLFEDYKSFLLSSHSEQSFKNAKQKIKTFHFFSSKTQITDYKDNFYVLYFSYYNACNWNLSGIWAACVYHYVTYLPPAAEDIDRGRTT